MRIAHLSDVHVIALHGSVPARLLNKRLSGYVNLRLRRAREHQRRLAERVLAEVGRRRYDHVVVTGDLTYLALEREFEIVHRLLRDALGLGARDVTIVPGNHDVYTRGSYRAARFEAYLGEHTTSDLPAVAGASAGGAYPFVRLRGPAAIIGLSTARPRPPLVASGTLGAAQRRALAALLAHEAVQRRAVVLVQHHPISTGGVSPKVLLEGLTDGAAERRVLQVLPAGLLLHGHLHRRVHRRLPTERGALDQIGATSASLAHPDPDRRAGFNVYELSDADGALVGLRAHRLTAAGDAFEPAPLPRLPGTRTAGHRASRTVPAPSGDR